MDSNSRKRPSSDNQDVRLSYAKKQIDEKHKATKPVDRLHQYVLCFNCIRDGFPQDNKLKQVIPRRDRLKDHYKKYHPDNVAQEWTLAAPQTKQPKLTFTTSTSNCSELLSDEDCTQTVAQSDTDLTLEPCNFDTNVQPEPEDCTQNVAQAAQAPSDSTIEPPICISDTKAQPEVLENVPSNTPSIFSKLYNCLLTIKDKVNEIYSVVRLLAEKHRVAKNPLMLEYGRYTTIENKELVIDSDGIQRALATCKNIMQVFVFLPFLGLDEKEECIICEFCTGTISYYKEHNATSKRFGNTKTAILRHVESLSHKRNIQKNYEEESETSALITKDKKAGMVVFRSIYGGLKMGFSYTKIIRELTVLHFNGVGVGNINHSKGTIAKIKDVLGKTLRDHVKKSLSAVLPCTKKPRPVSEMFDKMTHFHRTGQMQLVIAPLMNDHELFTAVYLDNYLTSPESNTYKDMINIVREVGNAYYSDCQVENASADGAYSKNENTRDYYSDTLNLDNSEWVGLKWDYAHQIDRAEHDSKNDTKVETHLSLAQEMTKLFRYGKEYVRVFGQARTTCISLQDEIINEVREIDEKQNSTNHAPVIQSNLKFAAHGCKFLLNYKHNIPKFVKRINEMLIDENEDDEKVDKFRNLLAEINVRHITVVYGLIDIYKLLSKAQHGVSTVNQFP